MALGLIGLGIRAADIAATGQAVEQKRTYDPASVIRVELARALSKRFSLQIVEQHQIADLTLDVRTSQWGFKPVRMGHYGITYEGTLKLVDTRNKTVIAEGACLSLPVDSDDAPTYDELLANDAMILKASLSSLEEFCTTDYRTRILGLYGQ